MVRRLAVLALLALPAAAVATGFGGSDAPTRIPVPAAVMSATVEDQAGTVVPVTRVSFDGEIYVQGKVGDADASVPFDKIVEVRIEPHAEPTKRVALCKLTTGESVRVIVEDDVPVYGETTWGFYKIEVSKVRKVVFGPRP